MIFSSLHLVKYFVEKSPIWFFFKKITWILVHIFVVNDDASVVHIIVVNDGASMKTGSLYCECNICVCDIMLFMKGCGRMEVLLNWFLTLALDQSEWLATFCILGKSPQYQSNRRLHGSQSWSAHFGEEKNLLLLPTTESWFLLVVWPIA